MRYRGQEYTINVPFPAATDVATVIDDFDGAHERRYGHASPGAPIEFVNLRVAALGKIQKYSHTDSAEPESGDVVTGEREVIFEGTWHTTPILARDKLPATYQAAGPLIIEEHSATTVVPPGWEIEVDRHGSIVMRRRSVE